MGGVFINNIIDLNDKKTSNQWTTKDHREMVNQCILDTKEMGTKYPDLTKEYCECSMTQIQAKLSKDQYVETIDKPVAEQTKILLPIFQGCLTEYQSKMKTAQDK
jgi:hypothetical protein